MDPATAFQIACGAFQLVGVAIKAISTGHEIYENTTSLSRDNERVERETKLLDRAVSSLKGGLVTLRSLDRKLTKDQQRLQQAIQECINVSDEIQKRLESMKPKGEKRKRDIPAAVIKQSWHKAQVKDLQDRLEKCQRHLDTELLSTLW